MKNVLEWLEATAERLPDKRAVADDACALSFSELKAQAQRAGSWLAQRMAPRQAVALYLEKSPQALAAMLGTVYAGGFYSVIDVRHPSSRVHAICQTLQPSVVICDEANDGHIYLYGVEGFNVLVARTVGETLYSPWQYYVKKADGQWIW